MTAKLGWPQISDWPEAAREAAQLVIDKYGEPDEASESQLIWHQPESLRFRPPAGGTGDPDSRVLSDAELRQAVNEGKGRG